MGFQGVANSIIVRNCLYANENASCIVCGIVLSLSGMGQAWRAAVPLWGMLHWIGEGLLLLAALVRFALLILYSA